MKNSMQFLLSAAGSSVFLSVFSLRWRTWCVGMCSAFICGGALAQDTSLLDSSIFGVTESQLARSIAGAQKIGKPSVRAGGLRGLWMGPKGKIAGHVFETTFFFRDGKVQRVEQAWNSHGLPCLAPAVYDDVVTNVDAQLHATAQNGEGVSKVRARKSAIWSGLDVDLTAFLIVSDMRCTVRLVKTPRVVKDASSL